ncbi:phosphotransferase-like protein [Psychromicrobium lacuslunae]|uniref:Phosphotransferase n=1 Tax=Psychromicrobium lacuslunae TaxID=1618207 RepID=A0A0D4C1I2_9MICC|nr:AAA family ATPase [Psychromicrobium lacuslunae]AJT42211.1 hypothetical protein UM93_13135 [Psychromicrobium lacuslunae]
MFSHFDNAGCLILSGTPAAGKSTVARLLCERMTRSAHVKGDDVSPMIVSGGVAVNAEPRAEAERQLLLRAHNICALANNFSEFGFYPVLDHVLPNRGVLNLMLSLLRPRPVLLVTLAPSIEVATQRNADRQAQERVHYGFAELRAEMKAEFADCGWYFDTSELSAEETADAIQREASTRALVAPRVSRYGA